MRGGRRTERESAGFTEKWFHGIIVSERNGYCEAIFDKRERNRMGSYLNPGNEAFAVALNSEIYVDKTGLLTYTNKVMNTLQGYICNSRPRRFGKSITANMLTAYYSKGCSSK